MYFPDLKPHNITLRSTVPMYYIGWLDSTYPYTTGNVEPGFLKRLHQFSVETIVFSLGTHNCPFCDQHVRLRYRSADGQDRETALGSSEMYIFALDAIYHAPCLIYHYVRDHNYAPPAAFRKAVLTCPEPGGLAYRGLLKKHGIFDGTRR